MSVTEVLSSQVHKSICEALGCNAEATTQITVSVGELGSLDLNLCSRCVPKFKSSLIEQKLLSDGNQTDKKDHFVQGRSFT